jgi:hypothetical protein
VYSLPLVVNDLVFLVERDGTDIVLVGSLDKVGITDLDFFFFTH